MKINVEATWRTHHVVDTNDLDEGDYAKVALGVNWDDLHEWPEAVLEQVTSATAELVDWEVVEDDS